MSDDGSPIEDELANELERAAEEAVADGIKRYVRPRIRSIRIPIPRAAPSGGCNPYQCAPQSCGPPGPCAPGRP